MILRELKKESEAEIQKIMIEFDKQADIYEKNKQTDVTADFFKDFIKNPKQGVETIKQMQEVAKMFTTKK